LLNGILVHFHAFVITFNVIRARLKHTDVNYRDYFVKKAAFILNSFSISLVEISYRL